MKSYFNNRLIYYTDTNIVYYTDFYKKYKFFTNLNGFKLLLQIYKYIKKMLQLNIKIIKNKNLNKNKILKEGSLIYNNKINLKQKKLGTWSIEEYKHLGLMYFYIKIKSFQRFTENWSILEKGNKLQPSVFEELKDKSISINVASIGGGPGFELLAFKYFFNFHKNYNNIKLNFYNFDLVDEWEKYYKLLGDEFNFIKGDFFELTSLNKNMDYIFFSNVFATYLNNINGYNKIINLLKNCKAIFINDRNKNLNVFKEYLSKYNINMIEILGYHDHRQIIITKNKFNINFNNLNFIFPNVPYIK